MTACRLLGTGDHNCVFNFLCSETEGFRVTRGSAQGEALGHMYRATSSICLVQANLEVIGAEGRAAN